MVCARTGWAVSRHVTLAAAYVDVGSVATRGGQRDGGASGRSLPAERCQRRARPFAGQDMARAFGRQAGIRRIIARFVELNVDDPRIKAIFAEHDLVRLRRTLVENLQRAMREAHVSFAAQNRLLAKLAPIDRDVTER